MDQGKNKRILHRLIESAGLLLLHPGKGHEPGPVHGDLRNPRGFVVAVLGNVAGGHERCLVLCPVRVRLEKGIRIEL